MSLSIFIDMKQMGYSIKDLETLSGIKMHTIRIWEKRYDLLNPKRTDTNIRFYDDEDLKRLLNISLLTKNGYKISKVAEWNEQHIKDTVIELSERKTSGPDYIDRLLLLMVEFNHVGFENLLDEILESYDFEDAYFTIFFKLFERVGAYWQAGSIFPAQEHYVSNLLRQKLISSIDQQKPEKNRNATMLFFLAENELHEMSLLFYSYLARKAGYRIIYLGQSVPFGDLLKTYTKSKVDFIFTAFINSLNKEDLEDYLKRLKEVFPKQKVFITGYQIQQHNPALPRNVKVVKDARDFKKYLG